MKYRRGIWKDEKLRSSKVKEKENFFDRGRKIEATFKAFIQFAISSLGSKANGKEKFLYPSLKGLWFLWRELE